MRPGEEATFGTGSFEIVRQGGSAAASLERGRVPARKVDGMDRRGMAIVAAATVLVAGGRGALAQEPRTTAKQDAVESAQDKQAEFERGVASKSFVQPAKDAEQYFVTFSFKGGSLRDYVDAMVASAGGAEGGRANVIVSKSVERLPVGAMSLSNVTIGTALKVLEAAGSESGQPLPVEVRTIGGGRGTTLVYSVNERAEDPFRERGSTQVEVFSIRDVVKPLGEASSAEEAALFAKRSQEAVQRLMTSISVVAQVQARDGVQATPPEIKLHEESSLLIVRGSKKQLAEIRATIEALRENAIGESRDAKARMEREARFKSALMDARLAFQRARQNVEARQRGFEQLSREREKGVASAAEFEHAKEQLQAAELDARAAEERVGMLEKGGPGIFVEGGGDVSGQIAELRAMVVQMREENRRLREALGHGATIEK